MTIGDRIREFRKANDLTQEKLAEFLGVSYQAVSKWENNITSPDLSLIAPLARLLHTSADELFGLNDGSTELDAACVRYEENRESWNNDEWEKSYHMAAEAVREFPGDFRYLEWLASAEYHLAYIEGSLADCGLEYSDEFYREMIENSIRHYGFIIDNCDDSAIRNRAIYGMVVAQKYSVNEDEARWYAEVVYPDKQEMTRDDVLELVLEGEELFRHRQKMAGEALGRLLHTLEHLLNCEVLSDSRRDEIMNIKNEIIRAAVTDGKLNY